MCLWLYKCVGVWLCEWVIVVCVWVSHQIAIVAGPQVCDGHEATTAKQNTGGKKVFLRLIPWETARPWTSVTEHRICPPSRATGVITRSIDLLKPSTGFQQDTSIPHLANRLLISNGDTSTTVTTAAENTATQENQPDFLYFLPMRQESPGLNEHSCNSCSKHMKRVGWRDVKKERHFLNSRMDNQKYLT